ncbi:MAG TPA: immunoglobulin domain-containing protein [Candidatus Limnocylindria bacterium]|jgi:hypothetical protein|nr:immunoglobulin domain-containing protein [Candidatus Limnocylindria bacterium]
MSSLSYFTGNDDGDIHRSSVMPKRAGFAECLLKLFIVTFWLLDTYSHSVRAGEPKPQVIYGNDDRVDVYAESDANLVEMSAAVCALVRTTDLSPLPSGGYELRTDPYTDTNGLPPCPGEPFASQPTGSFCTGFLVSEDVIVTAGHCLDTNSLADTQFIFGFQMLDANNAVTEFSPDQIYCGRQILCPLVADGLDYCVVRLDRPVKRPGVAPLKMRKTGNLAVGAKVGVIGYPTGLPLKTAFGPNTRVANVANLDYFISNTDTYPGNSGSPIINAATSEVEGIHFRGESNVYIDEGGCFVSRKSPDSPAAAMATRITAIPCLIPLPPPSGVSASDGTYTDRIHLTWNTVPNAARYEVWRNTSSDSSTAIRIDSHVVTTGYDDTSVAGGVVYYYSIKTVNDAGIDGDFSKPDSGQSQKTPYPSISGVYSVDATTSLTITAEGETDTEPFSGFQSGVVISQTGGTFSYTTSDPSSGLSFVRNGTLSGNQAALNLGQPIVVFRTGVSGLSVSKNAITSSSGSVQEGKIHIIAAGQATGSLNGTPFQIDATQDATFYGNVSPLQAPQIAVQPGDMTAYIGGTATFMATANGAPPLSYQWQRKAPGSGLWANVSSETNYSAASSATLTIVNLSDRMNQDQFRCVIANSQGATNSQTVTLTVNLPPAAPTFLSRPMDLAVTSGADADFYVAAAGNPPPAYQWQGQPAGTSTWHNLTNGGSYSGVLGTALKIQAVAGMNGDRFRCIAANSLGSDTSAVALLSVEPPPVAPTIVRPPQPVSSECGLPFVLSVLATGTPPPSYQWLQDGAVLPAETAPELRVASALPAHSGQYSVRVNNSGGSVTSAPVSVLIICKFEISSAARQADGSVTIAGISPLTGEISLETSADMKNWTELKRFATGTVRPEYNDPAAADAALRFYRFREAAPRISPPTITVDPLPVTVVAREAAMFTVTASGIPPLSYQWLFDGQPIPGATNATFQLATVLTAQEGDYSVRVGNAGGAVVSSVAHLGVSAAPAKPVIVSQPKDVDVFVGDSASFSVTAIGASPLQYQWMRNDRAVPGKTASTLTLGNVNKSQAGTYTVLISNSFGSILSDGAVLAVESR